MSKEPGPREKALRAMREANFERAQAPIRKQEVAELKKAIADAAKKKPKAKK